MLFPRILDEPFGDPLQDLLSVQDHDQSLLSLEPNLHSTTVQQSVLLILIKPGHWAVGTLVSPHTDRYQCRQ